MQSDMGEHLEVQVILPPNLLEVVGKGRVMVVFEGASGRVRGPLNTFVRSGPYQLSLEDSILLERAELVTGGDTPGMAQLPLRDFLELLPKMAGHPRVTLGRSQKLAVQLGGASLPLRANLEASGEILLSLPGGVSISGVIPSENGVWIYESGKASQPPTLRFTFLPPQYREVLQRPVRIIRSQVPVFLSQEWPQLSVNGGIQANFAPADFVFEPQSPRFVLELAGGLAQISGRLQCRYGARIMTVGVSDPNEAAWLPDPKDPKRYSTRDRGAEQQALNRLRQVGFGGPTTDGTLTLAGQDRVIGFFAREYQRLLKEWEVTLEERLDRSTRTQLERITPEFRVTPSGQQWFDLEVSYSTGSGERFSAGDIHQLLRGNGTRRLKNGKIAILDSGAIDEVQEALRDCAPTQGASGESVRYRVSSAQGGFLESTLNEQGFQVVAPPAWREMIAGTSGTVNLKCPHLGPLEDVLRPYQKTGVAWMRFLRAHQFGGVLADEMGLGKTLQVLAHLAQVRREAEADGPSLSRRAPSLVICPTSLVFNWVAEARRFTPELRVVAISGAKRKSLFERIPECDLVVTSYALVRRDQAEYEALEFDTLILDEAQHIKNRQTQNAQAVKSIRARYRMVLTGTPLENSVLDLWSIYDFLMPGYLGAAKDFRERYEVPIARERDLASMARLSRRIRPFLFRRLKRDVAKELPAKLEQLSYCDLNEEQAAVYQQLLAATRKQVMEAVGDQGLARSRMLVLTALLRLRQVCCDLRLLGREEPVDDSELGNPESKKAVEPSGKLQMFRELLDEIVDGGHRVLVFSQFTSMLALLREELDAANTPSCYLDGSTKNRGEVVDRFQKDSSIPVFLISLKAGGVGLNLTGADSVIHFDPWWNPAVEDQATDRAHRIGQTRVVTSYKLITRGTVEEKIVQLQAKKRELVAATLTGEEAFTNQLEWSEIQELLS
jgi:superfamily II DNA or RNA helicase